jgi:hypothetical protein
MGEAEEGSLGWFDRGGRSGGVSEEGNKSGEGLKDFGEVGGEVEGSRSTGAGGEGIWVSS